MSEQNPAKAMNETSEFIADPTIVSVPEYSDVAEGNDEDDDEEFEEEEEEEDEDDDEEEEDDTEDAV